MKPDPMSEAVKRMARRARRDPAKVYEEIEDAINRGRIEALYARRSP